MSRGYIAFRIEHAGEDDDSDDEGEIRIYCSQAKYPNHSTAAKWVGRALAAIGVPASAIKGKPSYPLNSRPTGAIVLNV